MRAHELMSPGAHFSDVTLATLEKLCRDLVMLFIRSIHVDSYLLPVNY